MKFDVYFGTVLLDTIDVKNEDDAWKWCYKNFTFIHPIVEYREKDIGVTVLTDEELEDILAWIEEKIDIKAL